MAFPIYQIAKIVAVSHTDVSVCVKRPFHIVETNLTSDGPRTRVCDGKWATQAEAEAALKEKMGK